MPFDYFKKLMDLEGWNAFTDHAEDPGRATKYGISELGYPEENIRELTEARARFLYDRDYWEPLAGVRWLDREGDYFSAQ
jgi:lysozyme family protein